MLYNIGCTTNLCDQFPSVALTPEAQFWMATMTFVCAWCLSCCSKGIRCSA